jgi:predicted RNase H-like nuclease
VSVRITPVSHGEQHHAETLRSGLVRGNYFHRHERELLVVLHDDSWTLAFDSGDHTPVETRAFSGSGAVRVEIDPGSAHAIRNDGRSDLHIFVVGNEADRETRTLIEPLTRIAGLDGCRAGWIAMVKDGAAIVPRLCTSDEDLVALFRECAVVAVDIPIGLAERGPRSCDHHARRLLGRRASCVFPAPLRPLLALSEYAEANRVSRNLQKRGISKQGWAIVPKVDQIDRLLQRHHEWRDRVYEIHPEVSFAVWNGGVPIEASKHTKEGLAARRTLVTAHFGDEALQSIPRGAKEDDALDALAALWTAERILEGRARELGDAHMDQTGLPMRIVY